MSGVLAYISGFKGASVDVTAPTLSSATIPTSGTSITLAFNETVSIGAGGNGGFTVSLSGGACTLTYSSGSGSSSLVYTTSRTVNSGETGTIAYTQPGNGVEDTAGNDLATIASAAITNNSTAGGGGGVSFGSASAATAQSAADSISIGSIASTGTNRLLVVGVCSYHGSGTLGVTSAAFNTSETLTKLTSITFESDNRGQVDIWYLINPSSTTAGININLGTGTESSSAVAFMLTGVHQTTPFGTPATTTANATSISVAPGSTTSDLVITALGYWQANTFSEGTGITVPTNGTSINSGTESIEIGYKAGASGTTTTAWSANTSSEMGLISVAVKPA